MFKIKSGVIPLDATNPKYSNYEKVKIKDENQKNNENQKKMKIPSTSRTSTKSANPLFLLLNIATTACHYRLNQLQSQTQSITMF